MSERTDDSRAESRSAAGATGTGDLRLVPLFGPPLPGGMSELPIRPGRPAIIGRASETDIQLTDRAVSRKHTAIEQAMPARGDGNAPAWYAIDLGSRHGTFLNGNRLDADQPAGLADGDQLRIGPWLFKIAGSGRGGGGLSTTDDTGSAGSRVQRVPEVELSSLAQRRLDVLVECAARIHSASNEEGMAAFALDAVLAGTGYARAALVRAPDELGNVEPLGVRTSEGEAPSDIPISRSLVTAAVAGGEIVRLAGEGGAPAPNAAAYGQSIVSLGIHSALAAPVLVGDQTQAVLYLAARGSEHTVQHDAAAFCQAVARITGLALSNLRRLDLERDLTAARHAQRLIMPPNQGTRGWHAYALETRPGRLVAGDLFDVIALSDDENGPVACLLGDVSGKGVGAAMTMATLQTHLRVALRQPALQRAALQQPGGLPDPGAIVREANAYLFNRLPGGKFVSLWVGIMDPASQTLRFVDAGHGHWLMRPGGGAPETVECEGGLPVGLDETYAYKTETVPFTPGTRVVLFSDGLVEQADFDGDMFGLQRAIDALAPAQNAADDVAALDAAIRLHAGGLVLSDDFTVASNEFLSSSNPIETRAGG